MTTKNNEANEQPEEEYSVYPSRFLFYCAGAVVVLVTLRFAILNPVLEHFKPVAQVVIPDGGGTPLVITWKKDLADTLRAEENSKRIQTLRDLWAGLAELAPEVSVNSVALQRLNQLAGTIAVEGLGPRNKAASAIITKEFEKLIEDMESPLSNADKERVKAFFKALSEAATEAL